MEQVIFPTEEREGSKRETLSNSLDNKASDTVLPSSNFYSSTNNSANNHTKTFKVEHIDLSNLQSAQELSLDQALEQSFEDDLDFALKLSASFFYREDIEAHNEAAFYTITTQGLAICQLRDNVNHRLRILHNLALYYYTKTAPQLRHLKSLEDVLELSPTQCSIATYYNNLAFMRLSAAILETNRQDSITPLKAEPFATTQNHTDTCSEPHFKSLFTTIEVELRVALSQFDQAFETNNNFATQNPENVTTQNAYYALHNYLIYQASGNHFKAKLNLEEALQAFEQTSCNRSIAGCHHYFSELYEHLGYYTQALEHIKQANRFEARTKATNINLSELDRMHTQFRKKMICRKKYQAHSLN